MNNTIDFLDKMGFGLAGAIGCALGLKAYDIAIFFLILLILVCIILVRITRKNSKKVISDER